MENTLCNSDALLSTDVEESIFSFLFVSCTEIDQTKIQGSHRHSGQKVLRDQGKAWQPAV